MGKRTIGSGGSSAEDNVQELFLVSSGQVKQGGRACGITGEEEWGRGGGVVVERGAEWRRGEVLRRRGEGSGGGGSGRDGRMSEERRERR